MLQALKENAAFNRWIENPTGELMRFQFFLEGRECWDTPEGMKISAPDPDKVIMNKVGIAKVMSLLLTLTDKNTTLSNITREEVYSGTKSIAKYIRFDLAVHGDEYDLDHSNFNMLCNEINNRIFFAFSRPMGQGERIFIKSTYSESVSKVVQEQQKHRQEGGLSLSSLFSGNKKD